MDTSKTVLTEQVGITGLTEKVGRTGLVQQVHKIGQSAPFYAAKCIILRIFLILSTNKTVDFHLSCKLLNIASN